MSTIEVEGLRIGFERRGEGPPLLLLHGGLSDHREWSAQLETLSDALTVVAWDAPGTGGSSDPPDAFRIADYARVLAGLIEALGIGRPHVCGLSWGSTLALALYRDRPDLPRSLILAAAYAGWAGSLPPAEVERRLQTALRDLSRPAEEYVRTWIATLLTHRASPEMAEGLVALMAGFHPAGARAMLRSMAEADLRDVLPTIAVPTLLLHGEEDVRSPRALAEQMQASIPGSILVLLSEVGHQCNVEAADRFNEEVRRFIGAW